MLKPVTLLLASVLGVAGVATAALPDPVRLDAGLVSGVAGKADGVRVFRGIPYAAPPIGELRWRAPQPVARWDGVRKADAFGPLCMQASAAPQPVSMSEDCLYLNVFTAATRAGEKRPVMVWLHPGGYTSGSGSQPAYDGETFAGKGVVIVTINYRLGALGFFSHPELTAEGKGRGAANQAFLDQLAALGWVKRNIGVFGGMRGMSPCSAARLVRPASRTSWPRRLPRVSSRKRFRRAVRGWGCPSRRCARSRKQKPPG